MIVYSHSYTVIVFLTIINCIIIVSSSFLGKKGFLGPDLNIFINTDVFHFIYNLSTEFDYLLSVKFNAIRIQKWKHTQLLEDNANLGTYWLVKWGVISDAHERK